MTTLKLFLAILITLLFSLSVLVAQGHEHQKTTQSQSQTKETYSCPMHPEVKSDKPGKCPKCGMNLEKVATQKQSAVKDKVNKATSLLKEAKDELMQQGKYSCCIDEPCNSCLIEHQSCSCYKNLKEGKSVCNECYAGWQRGNGTDKEIKPSNIKTSYKKHGY
ncbi:MAG: hypothetical protein HY960_09165 [Ignavibacteriae bacterium]|nr:hypothetical protein [Ignavibacteriota bacterium]